MSEKSDKDTSNTSNEDNIITPFDILKNQDINLINKIDDVEIMKDNLINKIENIENNHPKKDIPQNQNDNQDLKDINKDNSIIENNLNNENKNEEKKNKDDSTDNSSNKEVDIIKKEGINNNENKITETNNIKNDNKPEIKTKRFKRFFRYKIKTNIEKPTILKETEVNKIKDDKPNIEKKDNDPKSKNNNNLPEKMATNRNRSSLNVNKSKNVIKVNLNNDFQLFNSNNVNIDTKPKNCLTENSNKQSPIKIKSSNQIKHYFTLTNNNFYSTVNNKNIIRKSNTITKDNINTDRIRIRKRNTITNCNSNFNNNFVVSINCKKITHHVSAKSNGGFLMSRDNSKINTSIKEIIENRSNKGQVIINKFNDLEKSLLLDAPKKQCSICHKFIESHLFKIHTNNHPSQIFKWMYLGTFENACNILDLRRLGINYILNCAYDCKNTHLPKCITELHLKIRDESDFEIFKYFEKANDFINQVRSKGGIILIHCKLGISRSPSFVLAYLMKYYNFSFENALKFLRNKRPQVNPNEGFMNYLDKYEKLFKRKERKKVDDDINPNNK